MADIAEQPAPQADIAETIFRERLRLYFEALPTAQLAVVVNSLILGSVLWTGERRFLVGSWCTTVLLLAAWRGLGIRRFRRAELGTLSCSHWYREIITGSVLSGLFWGAAGFLFFDVRLDFGQLLLIFIIAGMCAGSIVSQAAFATSSIAFLALTLAPVALRFLLVDSPGSGYLAFVVLLYMGFMIGLALRASRVLIDGLEASHLQSRAERVIERQAMFDDLTGLPNRRLLRDRLQQTVARTQRRETRAALLFLDLDSFKRVNDSLGHSRGDLLLVEVAHRLRALVRIEDTAARLGGDEFVVLWGDIPGDAAGVLDVVRRRGERLLRAIEEPIRIEGNEIHITASIGVSIVSDASNDVETLLSQADTAMYQAKEAGRNTLRFFADDMQHALSRRLELERDLRRALDSGEGLELYLQPQYDSALALCGAESLLRWRRDGAFIPPATFIPIAEDCGLIYRLGDWVLDEACRIGASLQPRVADRDFTLAINVSPRQFRGKGFTDKVLQALAAHRLSPSLIDLELTEGVIIDDVEETIQRMGELRAHGVRFSVDDFGTGYSSLRYLKSLPLDTLKIDQSFVRDVLSDRDSASIVRLIISMAQSLELNVIAEGVETQEIHDFLAAAGCQEFQGYLYSRPVDFQRFLALLENDRVGGAADVKSC